MATVEMATPGTRFHELEGQGWWHQLVVPEDRCRIILQRLHGGAIGAHLGPARTLALAEQGFYWPGMRADVSKICTECDCAMLKRRRGRRELLHQYIVGVPMEGWRWTWLGHIPSPRRGINTASWWGAISRNGLSVSPSRIRRPRLSLGSWYTRLWLDMERSASCIAIRAQTSGQRWCQRCVSCSEYTR